ncbi:unnamed protein product, partial [Medioppia subpectinata]
MVMSLSSHHICNRIPSLTAKQIQICQQMPQSLSIISYGIRLASDECQRQFRHKRWNCTLMNGNNIFTHIMFRGSREASYTHSIRSAGVTYAISEACSRGNISFCSCHHIGSDGRTKTNSDSWQWSGCTTNIAYGIKLAKSFMDSTNDNEKRDSRAIMNLHNNNAGRKVGKNIIRCVKDLLVSRCKCHGVSGSCTARTCWKVLPPFTIIGDQLMKKYSNAKRVALHWRRRKGISYTKKKQPFFLKMRRISSNDRHIDLVPKSRDLVYLEKSINYCNKNPVMDSLGTSGRHCNKSSDAEDGCQSMCCGRGYRTHESVTKWKCRCRFHYCCTVTCSECLQHRQI